MTSFSKPIPFAFVAVNLVMCTTLSLHNMVLHMFAACAPVFLQGLHQKHAMLDPRCAMRLKYSTRGVKKSVQGHCALSLASGRMKPVETSTETLASNAHLALWTWYRNADPF